MRGGEISELHRITVDPNRCGGRPCLRACESVIVTKDEDFAQRQALSTSSPAIVSVRLRNTRRSELLAWFEIALPHILAALERKERLTEVV